MSEGTESFTTEAWSVVWKCLTTEEEIEIRSFADNNKVTLSWAMRELYPRLWTKLIRLSE